MATITMMNISDSVYHFIKYAVILGISLSFIVMTITSVLVRDTGYITKHPRYFLSETLMMGLLTSIPVLYISFLRNGNKKETAQEFALLFFKIIFLHVTFQLSGIYSVLFPESATM
ncbi:MAG: hypothetical protein EB127_25585 [Alphaproteobacteria bacterium]|nr:hypothetical protein [Alphaproteobacteria bacterium]